MMRLPKQLVERFRLDPFLANADWVKVWENGGNLIIDICCDEIDDACGDWDDGSGWIAALAPLRADVMSGDLRLFYLVWLMALEYELLDPDETEPLAGIGPLTGALEAAAEFFYIDPDLVQAAAEREDDTVPKVPQGGALRAAVAGLPEADKHDLLLRVIDGDPHVAAELRQRLSTPNSEPVSGLRTVAALKARAEAIATDRERAEAERRAEEQRRRQAEEERERRARLDALAQQGDAVWSEIETEIALRNASGYDRAAALLYDLETLAREIGTQGEFIRRVNGIRERHERKQRFIERLEGLAQQSGSSSR